MPYQKKKKRRKFPASMKNILNENLKSILIRNIVVCVMSSKILTFFLE